MKVLSTKKGKNTRVSSRNSGWGHHTYGRAPQKLSVFISTEDWRQMGAGWSQLTSLMTYCPCENFNHFEYYLHLIREIQKVSINSMKIFYWLLHCLTIKSKTLTRAIYIHA